MSMSQGSQNRQFNPYFSVSGCQIQSKSSYGYEMMHKTWRGIEKVPLFKLILQMPMSLKPTNRQVGPDVNILGQEFHF